MQAPAALAEIGLQGTTEFGTRQDDSPPLQDTAQSKKTPNCTPQGLTILALKDAAAQRTSTSRHGSVGHLLQQISR